VDKTMDASAEGRSAHQNEMDHALWLATGHGQRGNGSLKRTAGNDPDHIDHLGPWGKEG